MTDDPLEIPDEPLILVAEVAPGESDPPEVAYVVPAPAYQSAATHDGTDPTAEPVDPPPILDPKFLQAIDAMGEGLHRKLDTLQTLFDREIRAEATREKVVDRLHAELQEYKQGLVQTILRPVFVDLIQLHDDIGKMIATKEIPESDGEVARLLDLMRGYQQGIEDILYRQGVEPFTNEPDAFDPRRQRALSTVPTDDPAKNKQVAARLRKGFQSGDKVIRPEMVTVYAYK